MPDLLVCPGQQLVEVVSAAGDVKEVKAERRGGRGGVPAQLLLGEIGNDLPHPTIGLLHAERRGVWCLTDSDIYQSRRLI